MWPTLQALILYSSYCTISFLLLLIVYYKYAFNYWKNLGIQSPKPSFPFGNMDINFSKKLAQASAKVYLDMKKQGLDYCGCYIMAMPVFMPIHPNIIKHVLVSNFSFFNSRGFYLDEKYDPMGASIVTWSGDKWKKLRTKICPLWTANKIKMMLPIVAKCTQDLVEVVEECVQKGEPVNIDDFSKRFSMDVISSSTLGVEGNCLKERSSQFMRHVEMVFTTKITDNMRLAISTLVPIICKIFKINLFNPTATSFFRKIVHETVAYREKYNVEREDFLSLLIRLKNNKSIKDGDEKSERESADSAITLDQVASQSFIFILAGFETVSSAISFMLYELAKNPNIQQKIRQEIKETLKTYNDKLSYEALKNMRYLQNSTLETLRKYPTLHMLNRVCTKDWIIPGTNITLKKGTSCLVSNLGIHWDPEYYPNPEIFDPDRFTDEVKAARPPYTYLPFGDGPRICLGVRFALLEVQLCVASLLLKYNFKPNPSNKDITLCSLGNMLGTEKPILLNVEFV